MFYLLLFNPNYIIYAQKKNFLPEKLTNIDLNFSILSFKKYELYYQATISNKF